jgi:hypothetical protein
MTKDPLTHAHIGHAMKTHRDLGPGLGEEFYHQNFVSRLLQAGISKAIIPQIQGQPPIEIGSSIVGSRFGGPYYRFTRFVPAT